MVMEQQPPGSENSLGAPVKLPPDKDTFTKDEVQKYLNNVKSEFFRDNVAPLRKENEGLKTQASQLETRVNQVNERLQELEGERERAELEAAKGNPQALQSLQDRRSFNKERTQLQADKAALEARASKVQDLIDKGQKFEKLAQVGEVAQRHGIEPSRLAPFAALDTEALDTLAQALAAPASPQSSGLRGDSGVTTGTSGPVTHEAIEKMDLSQVAKVLYPQSTVKGG